VAIKMIFTLLVLASRCSLISYGSHKNNGYDMRSSLTLTAKDYHQLINVRFQTTLHCN